MKNLVIIKKSEVTTEWFNAKKIIVNQIGVAKQK